MEAQDGNKIFNKTPTKHNVIFIPVPLADQVIIRQDPAAAKMGAIFLPQGSQSPALIGQVVAVGLGARDRVTTERIPMDLEVGDRVYFSNYSGTDLVFNREPYKIMRESDVQAHVPRLGSKGYEEGTEGYEALKAYLEEVEITRLALLSQNNQPAPGNLHQTLAQEKKNQGKGKSGLALTSKG